MLSSSCCTFVQRAVTVAGAGVATFGLSLGATKHSASSEPNPRMGCLSGISTYSLIESRTCHTNVHSYTFTKSRTVSMLGCLQEACVEIISLSKCKNLAHIPVSFRGRFVNSVAARNPSDAAKNSFECRLSRNVRNCLAGPVRISLRIDPATLEAWTGPGDPWNPRPIQLTKKINEPTSFMIFVFYHLRVKIYGTTRLIGT